MLFQVIAREVKRVHYHTTTAALFTVADIKTILVPIVSPIYLPWA